MVLAFAILIVAPLISESLLGNTRVTMTIPQKCLDTFSPKTSTISLTLMFTELYLIFMLVVSHVSLLHIHISAYPKNDY